MAQSKKSTFSLPIPLPQEVRDKVDSFVRQLLSSIPEHAKELTDELQATEEMAERVRERIRRDSRKTTGRVV